MNAISNVLQPRQIIERCKGVATQMLQHLYAHSGLNTFTLDVVDNNIGAIRLYEQLGFELYGTKKPDSFSDWKALRSV